MSYGKYFDDIWKYDIKLNNWMEIDVENRPPGTVGSACTRYNEKIYLFGGRNVEFEYFDVLHEYNTITN